MRMSTMVVAMTGVWASMGVGGWVGVFVRVLVRVFVCASEEAKKKSGTLFFHGRARLASKCSRNTKKSCRLWKVVGDLIRE